MLRGYRLKSKIQISENYQGENIIFLNYTIYIMMISNMSNRKNFHKFLMLLFLFFSLFWNLWYIAAIGQETSITAIGQETSQEAGQTQTQKTVGTYVTTLLGYAGIWWLIFVIGIFLIIIGIAIRSRITISKILMYSGIITVFVSVLLAEILYVLPLIPVIRGIDVYPCFQLESKNLSLIEQIACIFSGITPVNNVISWLVWFVFLFILPLAILVSLFWEFTTAAIITHPGARRVIAFASALIAYRFLMAYLFVEFISVGLGGIALFFVNILFFGWAVNGIRRLFAFAEQVKAMREAQNIAMLERLFRMRDDLYAQWEFAIRQGNTQLANQLKEQLDKIDEQIENLRKKVEKEGAKPASAPRYA